MSCTIIVGGQFGSEGKGKVTALEAARMTSPWVVRCGGPNSGHTALVGGRDVVLRQVPSGAGNPSATLLIAAGSVIDVDVLRSEVQELGISRDRLFIDGRAVITTARDKEAEAHLAQRIGSTASGTGAALSRRMLREPGVILAEAFTALNEVGTVVNVARLLHEQLRVGTNIVVEGTQGFQLSLLHGREYPYVTSRDTTAAGFASEAGLSPLAIDRVIMVIRTFPIRVGGASGPFENEISWGDIKHISGAPTATPEYTSVTRKLRRVARFDWRALQSAADYNKPTEIAVMGLDRLDYRNHRALNFEALTDETRTFISNVEETGGAPVLWLGTGFGTNDALHREVKPGERR